MTPDGPNGRREANCLLRSERGRVKEREKTCGQDQAFQWLSKQIRQQDDMRRTSNPTWDYFKVVLFVVFLAEMVLF